MPTRTPKETLRLVFRNLEAVAAEEPFQVEELPLADHPFRLFLPIFAEPRILWQQAPIAGIVMTGVSGYIDDPMRTLSRQEDSSGYGFSPDILCRLIAKIAHGAASAELGADAFHPLLPDMILGKSTNISQLVGSARGSRLPATVDHEIKLFLRGGFVVARVALFAKYAAPYLAVVGRASPETAKWHLNTIITV